MTERDYLRRVKIVATVGPASAEEAVLDKLIGTGVNVVRVNSAHGTPESRAKIMQLVRRVADRHNKHIGLLVDLQGPRIRVGGLAEPRALVEGAEVVFAPEETATEAEIPTTYEALAGDVEPGATILLDDGLFSVEVLSVSEERVRARVRHGGLLRSNKGMNLPDGHVSAPAVTDKDREDVQLALANDADFIGISFVSRAEDVEEVRALVPSHVHLVAKIERVAALEDLERIVLAADAIMVARGDLGVELPFEEVPLVQKRLIGRANRLGRAVITATQMLESMIYNPRPTRAEASDVANAILDGTDAVMLSAETATGAYPVRAVDAMVRIIGEIEGALLSDRSPRRRRSDVRWSGDEHSIDDAIAFATTAAAEMLDAALVVCFTKSGYTARKIAANRPTVPIIGLSTEVTTCRALSLNWGVRPELATQAPDYGAMLDVARESLLEQRLVQPGDRIVVTAGVPFEVSGTTNLLKVEIV